MFACVFVWAADKQPGADVHLVAKFRSEGSGSEATAGDCPLTDEKKSIFMVGLFEGNRSSKGTKDHWRSGFQIEAIGCSKRSGQPIQTNPFS